MAFQQLAHSPFNDPARNASGIASRSAHNTGMPWITSPIALTRTMRIRGPDRAEDELVEITGLGYPCHPWRLE